MKHQAASNEETRDLLINANRLQPSASDDEEADFHSHTRPTMMTNDSLDSTGTKMLMPHEMGGDASLVGQHSIHHSYSDQLHHGASFYHHSPSSGGGFNGYHNSFHSNSYSNSTMITNNQTFSNLIHQQMNNNHSVPPPLIHQQTFKETAVAQVIKEEEVKDIPADEPPAEEEMEVPASNAEDENEEPEPEIDIVISNVVCAFSVKCPLALKDIALNGANVEYKRENGMVTMKLRKPYTTASIWSSGKITCTGATSEDQVSKFSAKAFTEN
jgi:Transcription factor TFIID (or TATA-binding protein, TBP)